MADQTPLSPPATRTKQAFREYLNREYPQPTHRNGEYRQRARPYGDYLYAQDREKFNVDYAEWLAKQPAASLSRTPAEPKRKRSCLGTDGVLCAGTPGHDGPHTPVSGTPAPTDRVQEIEARIAAELRGDSGTINVGLCDDIEYLLARVRSLEGAIAQHLHDNPPCDDAACGHFDCDALRALSLAVHPTEARADGQ